MIDLLTATQDAFFDALKAGMSGTVVQHVPQGTAPPLTVIGRIEASPFDDAKGGGIELIRVEIVHTYRGEQRRQLYAMMQQGRDAIEATTLTADGALFDRPAWQSSEADIDEDGVTYQGVTTFQVLVQPA